MRTINFHMNHLSVATTKRVLEIIRLQWPALNIAPASNTYETLTATGSKEDLVQVSEFLARQLNVSDRKS